MLVKINRVATRTAIRWKRSTSTSTDPTQGRSICLAAERPTYLSRLIACNRCGTTKETNRIQLRTKIGYRATHCRTCGLQEVCSRSWCQCKVIWHQCSIYRIDPGAHASRKGLKKEKRPKENKKQDNEVSSKRKAPISQKGTKQRKHKEKETKAHKT